MIAPLKSLREKHLNLKNTVYAITLIVVIVALIALNVFLAMKLRERDDFSGEAPSSYTKTDDFWQIDAVEPSEVNSGFLKITVASITGKIKYFDSVSSYKISPNGKLLALLSQNGVEIHNLDTGNVVKGTATGAKLATDKGETLSWSQDNELFLLNAYIDDSVKNTEVIIYKASGEIFSRWDRSLVVEKQGVNQKINGAIFSPYGDQVLLREYDIDDLDVTKEDGTSYTIAELPIYLRVYDLKGNLVQSLEINDFAITPVEVVYNWDEVEGFVNYLVYDSGKDIKNFPTNLYTKIRVKSNESN